MPVFNSSVVEAAQQELPLPSLSFLSSTKFWIYFFWIIWIHRYLRLFVHCISHWTYKSKPIPESPSFTSKDVTVVIPTIHHSFDELRVSLETIIACQPWQLILVTTASKYTALERLASSLRDTGFKNIRVLCTDVANKRLQVCEALPQVQTKLTIMADDDVTWPKTLMPWILAPFEDASIGGVGTCQHVKRVSTGSLSQHVFNWLGTAYIERRNFEISATHNMDGGTSCMSGRTGAYRSEILSSHEFLEGFRTEHWGDFILNADDDNFVTRWLVSHHWKTWVQYERACEVETTLATDIKFLYQCSRWARSNWRSNWTSLVRERHVWRQQPWSTYALHIATFTSLAFITDPLLLYSCWRATGDWELENRKRAVWAQFIFMFGFTKIVKLMGLFLRNPSDIKYLPVSILFGYFHGLIKVYALFTLRMTSWGSREGGDTNDNVRLAPWPRRNPSLDVPSKPDGGLPQHRYWRGRKHNKHGKHAKHAKQSMSEKTALLEDHYEYSTDYTADGTDWCD